jgi:hypothetical protein
MKKDGLTPSGKKDAPAKRGSFLYRPDARAPRPDWLTRDRTRYVAAISCVVLPLLFFFAIFQPMVRGLVMAGFDGSPVSIPVTAIAKSACVAADETSKSPGEKPKISNEIFMLNLRAADINGRYSYAVPRAVQRLVALIGAGFALFVILRRCGYAKGILLWGAGLLGGFWISQQFTRTEGTRAMIVEPIMTAVVKAGVITVELEKSVLASIGLDVSVGVVSTFILLIAVGVVAIRAQDEELKAAILRQRLVDLRRLMLIAAVILVLIIVITRALIDWQLAFLCEPYRNALKPLGTALTNYWGAGSSGVLLTAFLPAFFSWSHDVIRYAASAKPDGSERDRQEHIKTEGLDFAPASSATALLTVAIPALSGPLLDVVKGVAEKFG